VWVFSCPSSSLTYIRFYIITISMRHDYTMFKRYKELMNKKGTVWCFLLALFVQ
jgi:hypothetical protein